MRKIPPFSKKDALEIFKSKTQYQAYDYDSITVDGRIISLYCPKHGMQTHKFDYYFLRIMKSPCAPCTRENQKHKKRLDYSKEAIVKIYKALPQHQKYDYENLFISDGIIHFDCPKHGPQKRKFDYDLVRKLKSPCNSCSHEYPVNVEKIKLSEFEREVTKLHSGYYSYDFKDVQKTIRIMDRVDITCPKHGKFSLPARLHLSGSGCSICTGNNTRLENLGIPAEDIIIQANTIHRNKFKYNLQDKKYYLTSRIEIICPKHGKFKYPVGSHLDGMISCPDCTGLVSKPELELKRFIQKNYDGELLSSVRSLITPLEVDIYLPELKLAFEFDGLYWHSHEKKKDKSYHLNKTNQCKKMGVKLIHVFENEWIHKRKVVESRILNLLGKSKRIYGRNTIVRNITKKVANNFCKENHLQGTGQTKIAFGLFDKEELVSVMTFSSTSYSKGKAKYEWELNRFCNKIGISVVGGANKLLKCFEKENTGNVISYCDLRWSDGDLYSKLGFELSHISRPNYWYFHTPENILKHRFNYTKRELYKLTDCLEAYETITERELAKRYNLLKIFDCGNKVFIK